MAWSLEVTIAVQSAVKSDILWRIQRARARVGMENANGKHKVCTSSSFIKTRR